MNRNMTARGKFLQQISSTLFERDGILLEEIIFDMGDGIHKLAWVMYPMGMPKVNGRSNPFVHKDFPAGSKRYEAMAREEVRVLYESDEYKNFQYSKSNNLPSM